MAKYEKWNERLTSDFGIDLDSLPMGGIWADTACMLGQLISAPFVSRILEVGAGTSTLVMATVSEAAGKQFVSIEDKPEWAVKTNGNLLSRNSIFRVISTDSDKEKCPVFEEPFDLAWIDGNIGWHGDKGIPHDCCHRPGAVLYYQDVLRDAVIIFDDGEDTNCLVGIKRVISGMGRDSDEMFLSNPTKRGDRQQLISMPCPNHPAEALIKGMGHWYSVTALAPREEFVARSTCPCSACVSKL